MAGKKIMVIDDDKFFQGVCREELKKRGYEVWVAEDGAIALALLKQAVPDLILLDVGMPIMDGWTFLWELHSGDLKDKHIPIIVVTAKDKLESDFRLEGVSDFVVKPVDFGALAKKIEKALS